MIRRIVGAAATCVVAVASMLAVASPAQAASGPHFWMYTDDGTPGGKIDFWPVGDIVQLCDIEGDGWRARASVTNLTTGRFEYKLEASGSGVCDTHRASEGQPYEMAEGDCFQVSIWLYDGNTGRDDFLDLARWRNINDRKVECG